MARACEHAAQSSEVARVEWQDQDPHCHTQLENPRCPQTRTTEPPGARAAIRCANLPLPSPRPPSTTGALKCNPPSRLRAPRSLCRHLFPLSSSLVPLCLAAFLLCSRRSFLTNAPDGPIALLQIESPIGHAITAYTEGYSLPQTQMARDHTRAQHACEGPHAHICFIGVQKALPRSLDFLLLAAGCVTERREPLASRATSRRAS